MTESADVVVVGGGCHGASAAFQLARRGAGKIVLLEKNGIASGATGVSSAIVRMHYQQESLTRMALFGRKMFENFADEVGGDSGFRDVGFLVLFPESEIPEATRIVGMQNRVGIKASILKHEQIADIEPRLDLAGVAAACWEPDSGHADGTSVANAFTDAARSLGVDVRIGPDVIAIEAGDAGVTGVRTQDGIISTNTLVLAAGFRSSALLAPLGVELPINPIRHSIVIIERTPGFGKLHPVIGDRVQLRYFRPEGARMTLIGAHDPLKGDPDENVESARRPTGQVDQQFTEGFCHRFPTEVDGQVREGYTGVYDCTPDFQPALGKVKAVPGLHIAAGFSGHGFKLSPAMGKIMSEIIMDGEASLVDIDMFNIERFAKGTLIESPGGYSSRTLA